MTTDTIPPSLAEQIARLGMLDDKEAFEQMAKCDGWSALGALAFAFPEAMAVIRELQERLAVVATQRIPSERTNYDPQHKSVAEIIRAATDLSKPWPAA